MNYNATKEDVLKSFHISSLTLDNWIKNFIPEACLNQRYDLDIIQSFIIQENKLSQRANKKQCKHKEVPKELIKYLDDSSWLDSFLFYIENKNFIEVAEELIYTFENRILKNSGNTILEHIIPHNEMYSFSVAYQILLNSGDKSLTGAYYTPKFIVNDILESTIEENKTMLEPCCGVGFFVLEYIKIYQEKFKKLPQNLIFCNDLDPYAVKITELNIKYFFPDLNFQIKCENGLNLSWEDKFDYIITNPPYGIKQNHTDLKTTEIFSQFIYSSLFKYLKENGIMNFVLPSSVLSVSKHKEIRKIVLDNFSLEKIKFYGKSFQGVFSDIVYIQIKNNPLKNPKVHLILQTLCFLPQQTFIDNNYIISMNNLEEQTTIEDYYKIPHFKLDCANFVMGIVTGNNQFFISEKPKKNTLPILSGKEIEPGCILYENQKYILDLFEKFQQKPKRCAFLNKKIIYRFISNKIITAVDSSGTLTLNSANFFCLNHPDVCLEYISAILNSDIINKIHKIKNGNPLKVLKQHLVVLPIFKFPKHIQNIIVNNYKKGFHKENNLIIEKQIRLYLQNNT